MHSSLEHNLLVRMVAGDVSATTSSSCHRPLMRSQSSLNSVSHLEELMFWMYIVNSGPSHSEWFNSTYFKSWAVGSGCALLYVPLAAIFTREDPIRVRTPILRSAFGLLTIRLRMKPLSSSLAASGVGSSPSASSPYCEFWYLFQGASTELTGMQVQIPGVFARSGQ